MFPMMMQRNTYPNNTSMNQCMSPGVNCYENYYNNTFMFPQQTAYMNQQMVSSDVNPNIYNNDQMNFMFPQIQSISNMDQSQSPQFQKEIKTPINSDKNKSHNGNKKGIRNQFSKEEDQQLLELVEKYGDKKWKIISKHMPNRSTRQCHERYKYFLSPKLSNHPWTNEECMILEIKYQELGPKWAEIAQFLNNRSAVSVKNKWGALERKKQLRAMIPILNELYLTNHKILKGINIKKLRMKSKCEAHVTNEKVVKNDIDDESNEESHDEDYNDLFNEDSEESTEYSYNSLFLDNENENVDDDFLSLWENESFTF